MVCGDDAPPMALPNDQVVDARKEVTDTES
jgi:hypothetical protein